MASCVSPRRAAPPLPLPARVDAEEEEPQSDEPSHLESLPADLLEHVLLRLTLRCLARAACTCRHLRDAAQSPILYRNLRLAGLHGSPLSSELLTSLCEKSCWRVQTLDASGRADAASSWLVAAALATRGTLRVLRATDCGKRHHPGLSLLHLRQVCEGCPRLQLLEVDAALVPEPAACWEHLRWALRGSSQLRLRRLSVGCYPAPLQTMRLRQLSAQLGACDSTSSPGPTELLVSRQNALLEKGGGGVTLLNRLLVNSGRRVSLTSLALEYCTLGDEGGHVVASALRTRALPYLHRLSLRGCGLGASAAHSLGVALRDPCAAGLQSLDLRDNRLRDGGCAALCAAFVCDPDGPPLPLQSLLLGGNGLAKASGASLGQALASPACRLASLDLSGSRLTDVGGAALLTSLCTPHGGGRCFLRVLILYNCSIGAEAGSALGRAFCLGCALEEVRLGRNQLGCAGAVGLAAGLEAETCDSEAPPLSDLRVLDLSLCGVGEEGALALARAVRAGAASSRCSGSSLRSLSLRMNTVGKGAVALLSAALEGGCVLESLLLPRAGLDSTACDAMSGLLAARHDGGRLALSLLDLQQNEDFSLDGLSALVANAAALGVRVLGGAVGKQQRASTETDGESMLDAEEGMARAFAPGAGRGGGANAPLDWGLLLI